jgi:hypothetical protein
VPETTVPLRVFAPVPPLEEPDPPDEDDPLLEEPLPLLDELDPPDDDPLLLEDEPPLLEDPPLLEELDPPDDDPLPEELEPPDEDDPLLEDEPPLLDELDPPDDDPLDEPPLDEPPDDDIPPVEAPPPPPPPHAASVSAEMKTTDLSKPSILNWYTRQLPIQAFAATVLMPGDDSITQCGPLSPQDADFAQRRTIEKTLSQMRADPAERAFPF